MEGRIKGGEPLRQDEIASYFGVSSIPVREALGQLQTEGLATIQPRRGAVVSELSYEDVQDIVEIRIALETLAIREAMPQVSEEDLTSAEGIVEAIDREEGIMARWELNWEFHATLYRLAKRPRLMSLIRSVYLGFGRYMRACPDTLDYRQRAERVQQEHRQLIELCRQKDTEAAVTLLSAHIRPMGELLIAYFKERSL